MPNACVMQAARVPALQADIECLLKEKGRVENALGAEGRKAGEEARRSKAWQEQVEELTIQVSRVSSCCDSSIARPRLKNRRHWHQATHGDINMQLK